MNSPNHTVEPPDRLPHVVPETRLKDWRTVDTTKPAGLRQLDLHIAALLGYTYQIDLRFCHQYCNFANVINPQGVRIGDVVWNAHNPFDPHPYIHHYSMNDSAALSLMFGNREFTLRWSDWNGGMWAVQSGARSKLPHYDATVFIESTLALTVCIAWLEWQDQQVEARA